MSKLGTQSELDKLAATLALDAGQLEFLVEMPPQELRGLRIAIYERLFDQDSALFERLAAAGAHLPPGVSARLADRVLGPMITARVAADLPAVTVLAVARRVSIAFFADVCAYLDPRRTRDLIQRLPVEMIVEVATELVRRGEHMTISRFVDFVTDEQTRAVVDAIDDEAAILRVAFYMGSKNRMDHLFATLPRERMERLILRVEEQRDELLPAFLSVLIHVSYALRRQLGDIVAAQDDSVLEGYVRAAHEQGLWADVLPVVAGMSAEATPTLVNLAILRDRAVQASILAAADDHAMWGLVLPLVAMMDDSNREAVASIVASMSRDTLQRACDAALMGEDDAHLTDRLQSSHIADDLVAGGHAEPPARDDALARPVV